MAKGIVEFDYPMCKGCAVCTSVCPKRILKLDTARMNNKGYNLITNINPDECIGCGFCAQMCPDSVITVKRKQE
ncbi:MAG: 2-oxoacid:acceptor oxidoreductase [Treponema sp.]|nr:MAG: 2-oxoacid:acceptor oxidoreductase [Treponema sp.]